MKPTHERHDQGRLTISIAPAQLERFERLVPSGERSRFVRQSIEFHLRQMERRLERRGSPQGATREERKAA